MRDYNDLVEMDILVYDGTQKDVLDATEYLVDELGYDVLEVFKDEDETDEELKYKLRNRDRSDITSRYDIRPGTVILCMKPLDGTPVAIGYRINRQEFLTPVVSGFGKLYGADDGVLFGVSVINLDNDYNREHYENFKSDFKEDYERSYENFKDIMLVDAEQEEFYNFIQRERNRTDMPDLILINTQVDDVVGLTAKDIQSKDDILPGMILAGEAQREDESPQMGFMGYGVSDEAIIGFVVDMLESHGFINASERHPEVIRVNYKDGMMGFDTH